MNMKRTKTSGLTPWVSVLAASVGLLTTHLALAGELKEIDYSALPGNRVEIRMTLSEPVTEPRVFATDEPARLVMDLFGVTTELPTIAQPIGIGLAQSVSAVETPDRTRVVVNLADRVPYETQVRDNQIILSLSAGQAVGIPAGEKEVDIFAPPVGDSIAGVDFQRGPAGEGRVLVQLTNPNSNVNVFEEGGKVVAEFVDVKLPARLNERLVVTDFATPVESIDTSPVGSNVKMQIALNGDYEFMAYQADEVFTAEFRPLTRQEKEEIEKKKKVFTGERLSLNFQDIEVRAVLQLLADFTGLNMVVSDTVAGNITLRLQNVPWDQAMDIVLKSKGLGMRQTGNVVMVAPTEEIAAREKLELEAQKQVEELAPLRSEFIQVNYAKAADFAALLKNPENRLLSDRGQVTVDERTNTLLLQDTASKLEDIRKIVNRLDVPVRQVLIDSRIVIANDDFAKDLGVRLGLNRSNRFGDTEVLMAGSEQGHLLGTNTVNTGPFMEDVAGNRFNSGLGVAAENLMVNLPAVAPSGGINFLIGKVGSYLLQLELTAMQTEGKGEIISSPRVVTSDQTEATIQQGVEIPYQEASASGATTVSFKQAVLELKVTPHITPDDRVRMDLVIKKDNPDWSREVLGTPPIDTRKVETTVLVDNGETVVLGGVFERNVSRNVERVPFLGEIPFVGFFFRSTSERDDNNELLMFITPKILKETVGVR